MASLQNLPTELLIEILISCPTTRSLLRLSSVSRRMRAVWLEHSNHIIVANYKQRIPHIEQAIALILTEVQCGEIPKSPEDDTLRGQIDPNRLLPTSPESVPVCSSHESHSSVNAPAPIQNQPPIGPYLPRVLRNAGLASSVCDSLDKRWQEGRFYRRSRQPTEEPYNDSVRACYFLRHLALAFDNPHLQPTALLAVSSSSYEMLEDYRYVYSHMEGSGFKVWGSHAMQERNWDAEHGRYVSRRDPETPAYRTTERWSWVRRVVSGAYYRRIGLE
jgi:hypothetical protein